jgi:hypothetical protein
MPVTAWIRPSQSVLDVLLGHVRVPDVQGAHRGQVGHSQAIGLDRLDGHRPRVGRGDAVVAEKAIRSIVATPTMIPAIASGSCCSVSTDFDETLPGLFEYDLKRMAASCISP